MQRINRKDAVNLINMHAGEVFSVKFRKRSTGEIREGRFRLGFTVQKNRANGPQRYNFNEKGLIPVYRMAGDFFESDGKRRTIPIEGIMELSIGGKRYEVH